MPGSSQAFAARYDENNQEFSLSGTVRPETGSEIADWYRESTAAN